MNSQLRASELLLLAGSPAGERPRPARAGPAPRRRAAARPPATPLPRRSTQRLAQPGGAALALPPDGRGAHHPRRHCRTAQEEFTGRELPAFPTF